MFRPASMFSVEARFDSIYVESLLRELGRIGLAHMLDCENVQCDNCEVDYIAEYSKHLEQVRMLIDFVQSQFASSPKQYNGFRPPLDFDESVFEGLSFRDRLAYLKHGISSVEKLVGVGVEEVVSSLGKDVLVALDRCALNILEKQDVKGEWVGPSKSLYVVCGLTGPGGFSRLEEIAAEIPDGEQLLSWKPAPKSYGKRIFVTFITTKEHKEKVDRFVGFVFFRNVSFSDVPLYYLRMLERLIGRELDFAVQAKNSMGRLSPLMGGGGIPCSFRAWVPKNDLESFKKLVDRASGGTASVKVQAPKADDDVPILLDNPFPLKPFERILEMFSMPSYDEIDPTLFMAAAVVLFFGLMFSDVGHGALIVLVGASVYLFSADVKQKDFGFIALACGVASVLGGFIYGSFFGVRELIAPMWHKSMVDVGFMTLIFAVGAVHLSFGVAISVANDLMAGKLSGARLFSSLLSPASQMILYLAFLIPLFYQYVGLSLGDAVFVSIAAFVSALLLMFLGHAMSAVLSGEALSLADDLILWLLEVFHIATSNLSNLISYVRILILALIHEITSEIVLMMGSMSGGIPVVGVLAGPLIFVVGTVVILLEGVIVFIQVVRLNYYEFFNKFYAGGGLKFEPFSLA